jgi:uncharacterized membrane protein HdeD (DUF308 family)
MVTLIPEIVPGLNRLTWLGWALIAFGAVAIVAPFLAGKAAVILVGSILLIAGLAQVFDALRSGQSSNSRLLTLVLGAVTTVAAVFMLAHPLLGLRFLTYLLVAYLIGEGLWKIAVSLRSRDRAGYVWLLASGILSLLVGILIWRQWPLTGTTAVGILIGVNLVTTGIALLALAHSMRETLQKAIFMVPDTKP